MKVQLIGYEKKYGGNGYRLYCIYTNTNEGSTGAKPLTYRTSEKYGVCFPSVADISSLIIGGWYNVILNDKGRFAGLEQA